MRVSTNETVALYPCIVNEVTLISYSISVQNIHIHKFKT